MKNIYKLLLSLAFIIPASVSAATFQPNQGGTGTNCIPTKGQVLLATSTNGVYDCVATSTLGITGGGGGTPASPTSSIQFNLNGLFGGTDQLTVTTSSDRLNLNIGTTSHPLQISAHADGSAFFNTTNSVIQIAPSGNMTLTNAGETHIVSPDTKIENSLIVPDILGSNFTIDTTLDLGLYATTLGFPGGNSKGPFIYMIDPGYGSQPIVMQSQAGFTFNANNNSGDQPTKFNNTYVGIGDTPTNDSRLDVEHGAYDTYPQVAKLASAFNQTGSNGDSAAFFSLPGAGSNGDQVCISCWDPTLSLVSGVQSSDPSAVNGFLGPTGFGLSQPINPIDVLGSAGFGTFGDGAHLLGSNILAIGGKLGVGTTTPTTAVSVIGTTTTQGLRISNLNSVILGVDASGNVIATTTGGGTNFFSNSGSTTTLSTGSKLASTLGVFGSIQASSSIATSTFLGSVAIGTSTPPVSKLFVTADNSNSAELILQTTNASNNFPLFAFQNNAGSNLGLFDSFGRLYLNAGQMANFDPAHVDAGLAITPRTTLTPAILVEGLSGHSGSLLSIKDSTGTENAAINAAGNAYFSRVGIATSTPSQIFSIASSTNTNTNSLSVDGYGHMHLGGALPASVSCAGTCSLSPSSHDAGGVIIISGIQTAVTLNFAKSFGNVECISTDSSTSGNYEPTATTTTSVTFSTAVSLGTAFIYYNCYDLNN